MAGYLTWGGRTRERCKKCEPAFDQAARGLTLEGFMRATESLIEAAELSAKDELLGSTDLAAVHRWLNRRSGLDPTIDADQELENWQP